MGRWTIAIALLLGCLGPASAAADAEDNWGGLPPGEGRELVYYSCQACHSLAIVTQQGLSRDWWEETLVWMVEEQGMPEMDDADRQLVLDYLAAHYGPEARER